MALMSDIVNALNQARQASNKFGEAIGYDPQAANAYGDYVFALNNPRTSELMSQNAMRQAQTQAYQAQAAESERAAKAAQELPGFLRNAREMGKSPEEVFEMLVPIVGYNEALGYARVFAQDSAPAPIKIADEIRAAREAGDTQRVNDLIASAKMYDKGTVMDESGVFAPATGYGRAVGEIAATRKGMETQAEKDVELEMEPMIAEAKAEGSAVGARRGEGRGDLASMESKLPELEATVARLGQLAESATYTFAGQGADFAIKQLGLDAPEGAKARAEYIAMVDNQVLPLLRDTFGAQFTEREGEALRATLGDPNKHPAEKQAVLNAFIRQKYASLESKKRELGMEGGASKPKQTKRLKFNPTTGRLE